MAANPGRPPKRWMNNCIVGVKAGGGAADPGAVCGALWYHKMSPSQRRAALRKEGKTMNENPDDYKTWLTGVRQQLQRTGFGEATVTLREHKYAYDLNDLYTEGASPAEGAKFISKMYLREEAATRFSDYAANPTTEATALLIGLGALVVIGGAIWAVNRSKEGTGTQPPLPPAATCTFTEKKIWAYASSKDLRGSLLTQWSVKNADGVLEAPPWAAYIAMVPADKPFAWSPPLVVLSDNSFWTYDTSVSPAKPVRRDDLRDEYCKPPARVNKISPASAFLPGGG